MRPVMIGIGSALCAVIVLAGCAPATTGGTTDPTSATGTINSGTIRVDQTDPSSMVFRDATVEDVWKVLPAAFAALRIEAGVLDAGNRVFGNPKVIVSSVGRQSVKDLFRCGAEGLAMSDYRIEFGITAQPRRILSGGTELSIQTSAVGRLTSPSRSGSTNCVTNGRLEQAIHRQLQVELERIGKGGSY